MLDFFKLRGILKGIGMYYYLAFEQKTLELKLFYIPSVISKQEQKWNTFVVSFTLYPSGILQKQIEK